MKKRFLKAIVILAVFVSAFFSIAEESLCSTREGDISGGDKRGSGCCDQCLSEDPGTGGAGTLNCGTSPVPPGDVLSEKGEDRGGNEGF